MLKPIDIHNKEFKKVMRGYDVDEVDEFLDEIIVEFKKLQRELDLMKNQLNNFSESMDTYREKEVSLNNTLVSAQRFADQLVRDAEVKAAAIIAGAEAEAERMLGSTEKKYRQVLDDYTMLANRYYDARRALKDYFQGQINALEKEEAGITTEEIAAYLKQTERMETAASATAQDYTPASSYHTNETAATEEEKIDEKIEEIMKKEEEK